VLTDVWYRAREQNAPTALIDKLHEAIGAVEDANFDSEKLREAEEDAREYESRCDEAINILTGRDDSDAEVCIKLALAVLRGE
jgi:hypothetical protein